MGGLELVIFALVVVFYIINWVYRTVRRLALAARTLLSRRPAFPVSEAEGRPREQTRRQMASQQAEPRPAAVRPAPGRARRPDAGGPAVAEEASSAQFRGEIAEIESQEGPGLAAPDSLREGSTPQAAPALFGSRDDLVRAVILQEVLARPLSQRRRPRPQGPTPHSPH